jgi:hypothetical protein
VQLVFALITSTSTGSTLAIPDLSGWLAAIAAAIAVLISAVALVYTRSAKEEAKRQTKQMERQADESKRLSDATMKSIELLEDESKRENVLFLLRSN